MLGSPVFGCQKYFDSFFKTRIDTVLEAQDRLTDLDNPQVELHLLRSCLSLCKLNHLLRTVPPGVADSQLARFDRGLRHALGSIIHSSVSDTAWLQATLPVRLGGLGLRQALVSSPAAFLGSCNSTRQLANRLQNVGTVSLSSSSITTGEDTANVTITSHLTDCYVSPSNAYGLAQKALQAQIDDKLLSSLKDTCSLRDRARLNTVASTHAGAWLKAIPNQKLGLTLSKHEFITSTRIWLGIPIFPPHPNALRCVCGQVMDQFGDHALCCEVGPLRTKRHDALRDIIWHALLTDNSEVKREQRCSSHNHHRPGDIYHPDFLDGKPGFFDITVRSSLQSRHVISAANSAGAAAQAGELEKDDRHEENVIAAGGQFYPLASETLGYQASRF